MSALRLDFVLLLSPLHNERLPCNENYLLLEVVQPGRAIPDLWWGEVHAGNRREGDPLLDGRLPELNAHLGPECTEKSS